jgi:hypothetical protein
VRVADSTLARATVVAEVEVGKESLRDVLDALSFLLDAHYTQRGDAFVFVTGRSNAKGPRGPIPSNRVLQPEKQYGR